MGKYLKKFKLLVFINLILVILTASLDSLKAMLFKIIIDTATNVGKFTFKETILFSILFLFALFIVSFASKRYIAILNKNIVISLKSDLIDSILFYKNKFISERNSEILSILINDVRLIETDYIANITNLLKFTILFIVSLFLLLRINVWLTVSIFVFGWLPLLVPKLLNKHIQMQKNNFSCYSNTFVDKVKEILYGFEVIKGFGIEKRVFDMVNSENILVENTKCKYTNLEGLNESLTEVLGIFIFILNMMVATYFTLRNEITLGDMIAAVQLMNYIIEPLIYISKIRAKMKSVNLIVEKIMNIINNKEEYRGEKINESIESIEFLNVGFAYESNIKVLENINCAFEKGKKYAIVGTSGSGKSTLMKLIMRYYDNYQGDILINDKSLKIFNPVDWFKKISIIHQSVFLFNDTIKNNITLYKDFNEEDIQKVIDICGLRHLINKLGNGVNEVVGDNGANLSGGEKQRISIARALLRNSEVFLVDEATSGLDNIIAREVEETILKINKTVIVITHRYDEEIMKKYDNIIVLNDGKIVEQGSFNDLINLQKVFYSLYKSEKIKSEKTNY